MFETIVILSFVYSEFNRPLTKFSGFVTLCNPDGSKILIGLVLLKMQSFPFRKKLHFFTRNELLLYVARPPWLFCFLWPLFEDCFKLHDWLILDLIVFPPIRSVCYRFLHCCLRLTALKSTNHSRARFSRNLTCLLMTFFFASLHILMYKQPSLLVTTNSSSSTQCEEQSGSVCLVKREGSDNVGLSITIRFF